MMALKRLCIDWTVPIVFRFPTTGDCRWLAFSRLCILNYTQEGIKRRPWSLLCIAVSPSPPPPVGVAFDWQFEKTLCSPGLYHVYPGS